MFDDLPENADLVPATQEEETGWAESSEDLAKLYQALTPVQQRVLLIRDPNDSPTETARKAGIGYQQLAGWLNNKDPRYYSFKRLWDNLLYPDQASMYLKRLAGLYAPRNLDRLEKTASLSMSAAGKDKAKLIHDAQKTLVHLPTELERGRKEIEQRIEGPQEILIKIVLEKREELKIVDADTVEVVE